MRECAVEDLHPRRVPSQLEDAQHPEQPHRTEDGGGAHRRGAPGHAGPVPRGDTDRGCDAEGDVV